MTEALDQIPEQLDVLSKELQGKTHLLAGHGDPTLANSALQATKALFDLGAALESFSHPHLHPFLASITQPQPIVLRSSTKSKTKAPDPPAPDALLPYTPLGDLMIESMEPDQIWAQLELKTAGVCRVTASVAEPDEQLGMGMEDENGEVVDTFGDESDDDEDEESEDEGEEESMEEMDEEEFRQMMLEEGMGLDENDDEDEATEDGQDDGDEEEEADEEEDGSEGNEEDGSVSLNDDEDAEDAAVSEGEGEVGVSEEDDDDDVDLQDEGTDEETENEDEDEQDLDDKVEGGESDEDDMEDQEHEEVDDDTPSLASSSRIRPRHPTLDDEFFSIDDFNRITEEAEAGRVTSGRLGGDEDEEEELDDMDTMMLREADEDEPLMYTDFFEAPKAPAKRDQKGKQSNGKPSKAKKGKQKAVIFEDNDEEDEEDAEEDTEDGQAIMGTLKTDLFDDDEEEEEQTLSNHERRQLALAKQIAELEQEAVGPKDWTLLGEATSKARPENSLLEENLDFEQISKAVPVITEETVKTLEEMIKARILDNNFDSVVRVRAYEPTPFLPSRYFELQDTQSTKSLAQIYEDEYTAASSGARAVDARDLKLTKEHEEIDRLWGEICYKLDALSSLNFVPKQPKAQIQTVDNMPTTSMETALPPTSAAAAMLAPEEQFAPPTAGELRARTEMTPEEKQRARQRKKQARKGETKRLEQMAELYGRKPGKGKGVRGEKDEALKSLVKQGKGVTVVGKGGKEADKAKRRVEGDASEQNSKRLKL